MDQNEAFLRHWTRVQPVIAGYINAMIPNLHEAEDLLQNVAVALIRKFEEYDPQRPFAGWALGITKREILSRRRSQARDFLTYRADLMDAITEACEELSPELERRGRHLQECLKTVQGRSSEILNLRYNASLSHAEIAGKLGLNAGAVRTALSRIRDSLQDCVSRRLRLASETAGGGQ